jgi:hypothetical protein
MRARDRQTPHTVTYCTILVKRGKGKLRLIGPWRADETAKPRRGRMATLQQTGHSSWHSKQAINSLSQSRTSVLNVCVFHGMMYMKYEYVTTPKSAVFGDGEFERNTTASYHALPQPRHRAAIGTSRKQSESPTQNTSTESCRCAHSSSRTGGKGVHGRRGSTTAPTCREQDEQRPEKRQRALEPAHDHPQKTEPQSWHINQRLRHWSDATGGCWSFP